MGGVNVKNTIVERLLQGVAPHPCYGCGKISTLLCTDCKYNITSEPFVGCILCATPNLEGVCTFHNVSFEKAYVVSARSGALEALVNGLKFQYVKAAAQVAAELLHESLPHFPTDTIVVPIPTVAAHIRERGYDQVVLIAQHFAKLRGLQVAPLLKRANKATQHTLDRAGRQVEAKKAFSLREVPGVSSTAPRLIIDDIITTGATVSEAATVLAVSGAPVWIAAVAYQPLVKLRGN